MPRGAKKGEYFPSLCEIIQAWALINNQRKSRWRPGAVFLKVDKNRPPAMSLTGLPGPDGR